MKGKWVMLIEIPIQKIPCSINVNKVHKELVRFSCDINNKEDELFDAILSNEYLQSVLISLYNINTEGYPYYITIPEILLSDFTSLPFIQLVKQVFEFQRAMVNSNSIVNQVMVKDLTPRAINIVNKLYSLNKVNPIYEFLFKNFKAPDEDLNTVRAYAINKSFIANKNYRITNLHKYILWECISSNSNVYGLPIGALSLQDIENDLFKEFSEFFEEVYIIGYGDPWYATHMVVKISSEMMTNAINNIAIY